MRQRGFTLIELMIVVVIIGILAAIAMPNYVSMTARAKEGSTKSNMHTVQLAAEDYSIQNDGRYAPTAVEVLDLIPSYGGGIVNPFDHSTGVTSAWVDQATWTMPLATGSTKPGVVAYGDSLTLQYQVAGRGQHGDLPLILNSGRQ
jgi:prepilin-type N-terminal cleavage/methylation domain-containing protein